MTAPRVFRQPYRIVAAAAALFCALGAEAREPTIKPGAPYPNSALHWAPSRQYDVPPRLLRGNAPVYPITQAWNANPGEALVAFTVGIDGATHDVRVVRTTYPYFGSHTVIAVRDWKFEPARKNGRPVPVAIQLLMAFGSRK